MIGVQLARSKLSWHVCVSTWDDLANGPLNFDTCTAAYVVDLNTALWLYIYVVHCCLQQEESPLAKVTRDSSKITAEQVHGLMSQVTFIFSPFFCITEDQVNSIWIFECCLDTYDLLCLQVIKDILFNSVHPSSKASTSAPPDSSGPEPMVEA